MQMFPPALRIPLCSLVGSLSLFVVFASGCTPQPGEFLLEFEWASGPPSEDESLWVHGYIENDRGIQLRSLEVARYASGTEVEFPDVPYGTGYRVIIELRTGPTNNASVAYFGRSDPFDLQEGQQTMVAVKLGRLGAAPRLAGMRILEENANRRVNTATVTIEVTTLAADTLQVSRDPSFFAGFETVPVTSLGSETTRDVTRFEFMLDAPGCTPACGDGEKTWYVRAEREGYLSSVLPLETEVDTEPPIIDLTTVDYVPGSDSLVSVPNAGTVGTQIVVFIGLSERIDTNAPFRLVARNQTVSSVPLEFDIIEGTVTDVGARFAASVTAEHTDGLYRPELDVSDLAGNRTVQTDFMALNIQVKTSTPELTIQQDAVGYVRSPIGAEGPHGDLPAQVYFAVVGGDPWTGFDEVLPLDTFRLQEGPPTLLRFWGDRNQNRFIGSARPTPGGWTAEDLRLDNSNIPFVYVTGVDAAGNESAPVPIDQNWYIGTSYKPDNRGPNTLSKMPQVNPTRIAERGDFRQVFDAGAPGRLAQSQEDPEEKGQFSTVAWTRKDRDANQSQPSRRLGSSLDYDVDRGRLVLFAGQGEAELRNDLWEWSDAGWVQRGLEEPKPSPRRYARLAYDPKRARFVLFGGFESVLESIARDDMWEWDPVRDEWTQIAMETVPPARANHSLVYDPTEDRLLMFGGFGDAGPLNDLWSWDGEAWQMLMDTSSTATDRPLRRDNHKAVFDTQRGCMVVFSGFTIDGPMADTWEYCNGAWREVMTSSTPVARWDHAMAYDQKRNLALLFGGWSGRDPDNNFEPIEHHDLWGFDGTNWTMLDPGTDGAKRWGHVAAYDSLRERLVVYSGRRNLNDVLEEFRVWDDAWSADTVTSPPARNFHAGTYDSVRNLGVIAGGLVNDFPVNDAWTWDGETWREAPELKLETPEGEENPEEGLGLWHQALAYDELNQRLVMFGGRDFFFELSGSTYVWENGTWSELCFACGPGPRQDHTLTYDPWSGRVILTGGQTEFEEGELQDTWALVGQSWVRLGDFPTPCTSHSVSRHDPVQGLVATCESSTDVYRLVNDQWMPLSPYPFGPRRGHTMTYDPVRQWSVVVGGFDDAVFFNDAWIWAGNNNWFQIPLSANSPTRRNGQVAFYDSARQETVLFGGGSPAGSIVDTYTLTVSEDSQPGYQFDAGLPSDFDLRDVVSVGARTHCGGAFAPYGPQDVGAALMGWFPSQAHRIEGGWQQLASNSVAADTVTNAPPPAGDWSLQWRSEDAAEAQRLLLERDRLVSFQCRPNGVTGNEQQLAKVALDFIEVVIGYAHPDVAR